MEESVGKRLSKARLKRGLSIDEAAHATRLRPDKIVALENDDYSLFASNVYARGFLQIYGRFLEVDVSEFASTLEGNASISIEDYQYLNSGAPPRREERVSRPIRPEKRGPSFVSIFLFIFLFGGLCFALNEYIQWQRLESAKRNDAASPAPAVVGDKAKAPATVAAQQAPPQPAAPVATPALRAAVKPLPVSDRDFVAPSPIAPHPATTTTPTASNEVLVQPLKKTWIVVRKDDPASTPIFEDYLYPDSPALKLKGLKFFIEARDPSAIEIRKNGAPMAYQPSGVEIH